MSLITVETTTKRFRRRAEAGHSGSPFRGTA
jgi:hypothetical protein